MVKEVDELAKARAQRVRSLREALRYSREKFCKCYAKHGITYAALQSWEAIRWNGLTENGARKLAACFQEEGLNVSVEWLLFAIGHDPLEEAVKKGITKVLRKDSLQLLPADKERREEKRDIVQELILFHRSNPGSVDAIVMDEGLAPYLQPGDYVAGRRYFNNDMEKGLDCPCIVQMLAGGVLVRLLKKGPIAGHYTLECTNPAAMSTLENVKLFSAAPILWVRKPT